jgi:hypothetical protein
MDLTKIYTVETEQVQNKPGCWNSLKVSIKKDGNIIGSYIRTYNCMYDTFFPFENNGKHYALISDQYTKVSVMDLSSCEIIMTNKDTFCPTGFYVPSNERAVRQIELLKEYESRKSLRDKMTAELPKWGTFGIVCGCYWGDDSGGWKAALLKIDFEKNEVFIDHEAFGYLELPSNMKSLKDSIEWGDHPDEVDVIPVSYYYKEGTLTTDSSLNVDEYRKGFKERWIKKGSDSITSGMAFVIAVSTDQKFVTYFDRKNVVTRIMEEFTSEFEVFVDKDIK